MKKTVLFLGILFLICQNAHAGIITNLHGNNYYYPNNSIRYRGFPPNYNNNNNYYYNHHRRHCPYHRYYNPYPNNFYYNQQPVIYRTRVRRSLGNQNEKPVANQFSELSKIEKQILLQTYEYDNAQNRIERLEHKIFGAAQSGSLEERFFVLKSAAKNYKAFNPDSNFSLRQNNSYYDNGYRPPLFTGTMGSSWKNNLLGNFRNQLTGTPTGFTPAMDPAYMDWFEAERAMMKSGQDIDYRTNTGYYKSNTNRGAATGVTILD